jgi:hypothetical protein
MDCMLAIMLWLSSFIPSFCDENELALLTLFCYTSELNALTDDIKSFTFQ